jgi:hypothetical protein
VGKDEFDVVGDDMGEECTTVGMGILDEGSGAGVEIGEEVPEDVYGGFARGERREAEAVH